MRIVAVVGTEKGAFLCTSDRGRRNWNVEGPIFKGWKVTATARSPSGRYFVATGSQVYGAALHVSTDLKTWRQMEHGPAYPEGGDRKLNQIWKLHTGADRHFAGVDTAGLFTSDDDGDSWQPVSGLNDHPSRSAWFPGNGGLCAHAILAPVSRPQQLWCGISAVGVWRSDDGGVTWETKNEGVRAVIPDENFPGIGCCVHGLAQDPDNPDVIYRQDHTGMYRSRDGGDHWEKNEQGLSSWFGFPIAMDPHTKALFSFPMESDEYRLPVGGTCAIYRSTDNGDSWQAMRRGLPEGPYYAGILRGAMDVDGLNPAGVYVGSTSGDLFISADGGDSWQRPASTLPRILSVNAYVEE